MSRRRGARQSVAGRFLGFVYGRVPARRLLLAAVVKWEGGQFYSQSMRVILRKYHQVVVGEYSYGSLAVPGHADPGTTIGRYSSIGPNVRRIGAAHPVEDVSLHPFWYNPTLGYVSGERDVERVQCVIGNDVWIGANVVILPGCRRVGDGSVIGAGSIVTRDVGDFEVVAGNPARHMKFRLTEEQRTALRQARPWNLEPALYSQFTKSCRFR